MSDDSEEIPSPPRPGLTAFLRKIAFALGILLVLWMVTTKGLNHPLSPQSLQKAAREAQNTITDNSKKLPPASPDAVKTQEDAIAELRNRIDQLEARLKSYEANPAASAPVPNNADKEHIAQLEAQLNAQAKNVEAMEAELKDMQSFKGELGKIEAQSSTRLAAFTAFGIMKDTIERGDPFTVQINQLTQLAQADAKTRELLDKLRPFAEKGGLTAGILQNQFAMLLPHALSPEQDTHSLWGNIRSLVRIRKVGEQQSGNDDESILARAEAKLSHKDVEGAEKELAALSKPAAAVFAPWMKNAQVFLRVRALTDALQLTLAKEKPAVAAAPVIATPKPAPAPASAAPQDKTDEPTATPTAPSE